MKKYFGILIVVLALMFQHVLFAEDKAPVAAPDATATKKAGDTLDAAAGTDEDLALDEDDAGEDELKGEEDMADETTGEATEVKDKAAAAAKN